MLWEIARGISNIAASFFTSQSLVTDVDFNEETDFRNARFLH